MDSRLKAVQLHYAVACLQACWTSAMAQPGPGPAPSQVPAPASHDSCVSRSHEIKVIRFIFVGPSRPQQANHHLGRAMLRGPAAPRGPRGSTVLHTIVARVAFHTRIWGPLIVLRSRILCRHCLVRLIFTSTRRLRHLA